MDNLARKDDPSPGAVVLAFPPRRAAPDSVSRERPPATASPPRALFAAAVTMSLALHGAVLAAFIARQAYDLERAAGSAAALAVAGAAELMEVEIVAEPATRSAAVPTNATEPDAEPAAAEPERSKAETVPPPRPATPHAPAAAGEPKRADAIGEPVPVPTASAASERPQPEQPDPRAQDTRAGDLKRADRTEAEPGTRETPPVAPSAAASPASAAASRTAGRIGALGDVAVGGAALVSSYQAQVLAHLQRFRTYPPEARSRGITGVAAVRFALGADGRLLSASLARSSGQSLLDEAAVAMVRRASPFPPFPAGLNRTRLEFAAPLRFDLR